MAIVSDPDVIGGRWRIDGTRLDVMMLRTTPRAWLLEQYEHVPVTNEMIDEALAWNFPPIRDSPQIYGDDLNLICVCGECVLSSGSFDDGEFAETCPACGKRWRLTITLHRDWKPLE